MACSSISHCLCQYQPEVLTMFCYQVTLRPTRLGHAGSIFNTDLEALLIVGITRHQAPTGNAHGPLPLLCCLTVVTCGMCYHPILLKHSTQPAL